MKKTLFLVALLGIAAAGCSSTNNEYQGTPPTEYGTEQGQGNNWLNEQEITNAPPTKYPQAQGDYNLWRYRGITPNTP